MQAFPDRTVFYDRQQETAAAPARITRHSTRKTRAVKARSSRVDAFSIALAIGLTAAFIVFIFCLVTALAPSTMENLLLSGFVGLTVGCTALAFFKGD